MDIKFTCFLILSFQPFLCIFPSFFFSSSKLQPPDPSTQFPLSESKETAIASRHFHPAKNGSPCAPPWSSPWRGVECDTWEPQSRTEGTQWFNFSQVRVCQSRVVSSCQRCGRGAMWSLKWSPMKAVEFTCSFLRREYEVVNTSLKWSEVLESLLASNSK